MLTAILREFSDNLNLTDRQLIFSARWCSCPAINGPERWHPRSPNRSPSDFVLKILKGAVYERGYENIDDLQQNIMNIVNNIEYRTISRIYKYAQKYMYTA